MEKEKSNIQGSVCVLLPDGAGSSNQTSTVRMSPMTEMLLNHVQAFYENKGAAVYSQAFVYGNQNALPELLSSILLAFVPGWMKMLEI